jgi:ribosomal protein L35AE/L33A
MFQPAGHHGHEAVINTGCSFYLGKKVAYVYRGQKEVRGTKIRVIWGKVTRPHGRNRWLLFCVRYGLG